MLSGNAAHTVIIATEITMAALTRPKVMACKVVNVVLWMHSWRGGCQA